MTFRLTVTCFLSTLFIILITASYSLAHIKPNKLLFGAAYYDEYMPYDRLDKDIVIMHPGPINRGVEIDSDIADCKRSLVLEQVTNGLAVRMAVLFLVNGGKGPQEIAAQTPADQRNINRQIMTDATTPTKSAANPATSA